MIKQNVKPTLAKVNRALARQWHPTKNAPLTPKDVTPGAHIKVWWLCDKGHEWDARISDRGRDEGCPYCSGRRVNKDNCLKTVNPKLAREWHPTKNAPLTTKDVTAGSGRKVWWVCKKGHEWPAPLYRRTSGYGCPCCSGRQATADTCLQAVDPKLAREWHHTKNAPLTPKDVLPKSNKKVWWICRKGHEWQSVVENRSEGDGCPYCSGRRPAEENCLEAKAPWLSREWHSAKNGTWTPKDVSPFSTRLVWWKCRKGHEYRERIIDRYRRGGCPVCTLRARASRLFRERGET